MGLSRTVSEINGAFCQTPQIFPALGVSKAPIEGVPLETGYRRLESKTRTGLPGREKSSITCIFSRLYTIHERDGRTPADSKDRAYA